MIGVKHRVVFTIYFWRSCHAWTATKLVIIFKEDIAEPFIKYNNVQSSFV